MARILYFIGAGLTKALALPTHPVPAMFDFISTSAEYINDDVILATLTDLERCDPYPYAWRSREARSLALELLEQKRQNGTSDPTVCSRFARALRDRPGESIEDLLERTCGNGNWSSKGADDHFRFAIRQIFTLIGWNIAWSPLISFLTRQFERAGSTHTFVSFNYDLVLERGIQLVPGDRLHPTRLYGFPITLQVTGDPPSTRTHGAVQRLPATALSARGIDSELLVLKPHGSLNWLAPIKGFYDESKGDDLRQGRSVIVPLGEDGALRYFPTTDLPPDVQVANDLPIEVEPVIVTPRGAKKPERQFLRNVREREEAAILAADEVYVLGWSIPRTDTDQECLIRHVVGRRSRPFEQLTVVNFVAGVDYYLRAQDIFGVEHNALRTY